LEFTNPLLKKVSIENWSVQDMRRSKLELYEDMLRALADKPLTVDSIAYRCNMDCVALHQRLDFLVMNGLVKKEDRKKKTFYALTKRGLAISKTLAITKHLEKLQTSIGAIDDALQAVPAHSEYSNETTK
jgi:predicted transcriptional regulator